MDYYIEIECQSCYEPIYYGVNRTYSTHNDLPVISWDIASQTSFDCAECDKTTVTGDFESMSEEDL